MDAKLRSLRDRTIDLHVRAKTYCPTLHKDTVPLYELAFDAQHKVEEAIENVKPSKEDEDALEAEAYALAEELDDYLAELVAKKNSIGLDNALRGLKERSEDVKGNLMGYDRSISEIFD